MIVAPMDSEQISQLGYGDMDLDVYCTHPRKKLFFGDSKIGLDSLTRVTRVNVIHPVLTSFNRTVTRVSRCCIAVGPSVVDIRGRYTQAQT